MSPFQVRGLDDCRDLCAAPQEQGTAEKDKKCSLPGLAVKLKNVNFRYPTNEERLVLEGVTLDIASGQKIALVGGSGCGKSTIVQLLGRCYEPETGGVFLNNTNLQEICVAEYERALAWVSQEPTLFQGTLRQNLLFGMQEIFPNRKLPTDEELLEACDLALVKDVILRLPAGLDTIITGSSQFSGGQKQRIALARALVRKPRLLLLDEATSALDYATESCVVANLRQFCEKHRITTVVVAHRLSTVRDADKIFVFEEGKLVEEGVHDELAQKGGKYATLVELEMIFVASLEQERDQQQIASVRTLSAGGTSPSVSGMRKILDHKGAGGKGDATTAGAGGDGEFAAPTMNRALSAKKIASSAKKTGPSATSPLSRTKSSKDDDDALVDACANSPGTTGSAKKRGKSPNAKRNLQLELEKTFKSDEQKENERKEQILASNEKPLARIWGLHEPWQKWLALLIIAISFVRGFAQLYTFVVSTALNTKLQKLFGMSLSDQKQFITDAFYQVVLVGCLTMLATEVLRGFVAGVTQSSLARSLRSQVFRKLMLAEPAFFDVPQNRGGRLLSLLSNAAVDLGSVLNAFFAGLMQVCASSEFFFDVFTQMQYQHMKAKCLRIVKGVDARRTIAVETMICESARFLNMIQYLSPGRRLVSLRPRVRGVVPLGHRNDRGPLHHRRVFGRFPAPGGFPENRC